MARPREFDTDTVVERAMEAFWTHGYAGTSPAQLAESTGVAKGSLYNAFSNKRELFDRALQRYDELGVTVTDEVLNAPGTTRERLADYLRMLVAMDTEQPVRRGCLAVNTSVELAGHDPEIVRTIRGIQEHSMRALAARIDRGRRDGDVRADADPQALAEFLMNTIVGLRVMAKTHDEPMLNRIVDQALTVL